MHGIVHTDWYGNTEYLLVSTAISHCLEDISDARQHYLCIPLKLTLQELMTPLVLLVDAKTVSAQPS